ncbi:MAG: hypothetical protein N3F63_07430 [Thermoplasmata archaeon]|nr:hypothetical protein [Thermoplasmata archaeon]
MSCNRNLDFYIVKLCSGRTAYEALPKKGVKFRVSALAEKLRANGYTAEEYGSLLIARRKFETTIFPSGRLLMKCNESQDAREEAARIGRMILELGAEDEINQK